MQVEDKEINGFQIENFNQHGLDVGKSQGTCPLCSSSRKPENRKAKCASYDWERGLGTCHNCDKSFQLHTFKRKGKAERDYVVPTPTTVGNLDDKVVDWFKSRSISEIHESGYTPVISVPNGATLNTNNLDYLDNCIDYFEDKKKIIIAVDDDPPGLALQAELIRRLGAEVCFIATFDDCKDANEYLVKHGTKELMSRIDIAHPVPLENVTTFRDIEDEVTDFVRNGFKRGFQIGLHNFDNIFSTYTKQFITVTGVPSSGKSDFVDQMCVGYNKEYGWKTAFASPENAPTYLHAHKLMRKVWGDMPNKGDIGGDKWNQVANHVNDNFFFIDMERYTLESVLRKGAELVKRKGIKCLVIDPYNKVRDTECQTEDVNRYTMEYLTKIETFAKKYDVLVFIVAHPTKMYKGQDGKIEEPTMYNIKGGGEWYDASYHGLLVHRDYEAKTTKVKVLKVKFQNLGENGAEAHFTWEPRSGCFVPHEMPGLEEQMPWD
jgi:twinkle protein